jgi:ABC-type uncharacterized transport system substrate-binding protein
MKLLTFLLFPLLLFSHPHLFIDVEVKKSGSTLLIDWLFDEMNSEILIMDYDKDFDGIFSENEVSTFVEEVLSDLIQNYNFYTVLEIDGKKIPATSVLRDFKIKLKNNRFSMNFKFNLSDFQNSKKHELLFYDESFMSAFLVKEKDLSGFGENVKVIEDDDFYGYTISWGGK